MNLQQHLRLAYRVSRPRFWFYLTGTYTVGCIWAAGRYLDLLNLDFFLYFFYWLFPANLFLYGVNDLWDYETDLLNPKKEGKEYRVKQGERVALRRVVNASILFSLLLLPFQRSMVERLIFLAWLFLGYFYSAKPLRFKSVPFLDSASNILYASSGVLAFYQVSGALPPVKVLAGAFMHTFAMHLFSAVPDIAYDRETGIRTTAVLLGRKASLLLCLAMWTGLAYLTLTLGGVNPLRFLPLTYPLMVGWVLVGDREVEEVYWFYPYINIGFGGLLFLVRAAVTPW